jgi:glycosyltransferase involved in cell wall biosynthesis
VRIYRDPVQGEALGQAGRERVEKHFDVRRMVAEYEALYAALMESRRGGRKASRRLKVRER